MAKSSYCAQKNAYNAYPGLRGAIIHSDRGVQYTSSEHRAAIKLYGINQSMNSDGGRCHDNARCESMWARLKEELFYEGLPPLIKRRMYYESEMGMVDRFYPVTLPSTEQINCIFIWIHLEAVTYDCHQAIYALSHIYDPSHDVYLADAGKIS